MCVGRIVVAVDGCAKRKGDEEPAGRRGAPRKGSRRSLEVSLVDAVQVQVCRGLIPVGPECFAFRQKRTEVLRLLKNRVMSDYVYTIFVRQSTQTVCPSHQEDHKVWSCNHIRN